MSMSYTRQRNLRRRFVEETHLIYDYARTCQWSSAKLSETYIKRVLANEDYKELPRYERSYLEGVRDVLDSELWNNHLVFTYEIDGVRMAIDDPRYRAVPASEVNDKYSHTGAYSYRDDVTKLFYQSPQRQEMRP